MKIIGRLFHRKISVPGASSSIKAYLDMVPWKLRDRVALTSATSTNIRSNNLLDLVSPFLVQGNNWALVCCVN